MASTLPPTLLARADEVIEITLAHFRKLALSDLTGRPSDVRSRG